MKAAIGFVPFCERVLKLQLTRCQRVLASVAFGGVEPEQLEGGEERELARMLFGPVDQVPALARRILVLRLGRGSGKTTLASAFALYVMLTADVSRAGPGSVPTVVAIAPAKRTAKLSVRMALEMAKRTPEIRRLLQDETTEGFSLRRLDGKLVAFEAFAASRGGAAARGIEILMFILDEAEFFTSSDGGGQDFAINDKDVFGALIPRLMAGGKGVFISSPWPVPTMMGETFDKNFGEPRTALAARGTTLAMRDNDPATAELISAERLRDPDTAAREFDCVSETEGGGASFFDELALQDAVDTERAGALVLHEENTGIGADVGLIRDSSAIAACVYRAKTAQVRLLEYLELRPAKAAPLKLSATIEKFAEFCGRHRCNTFMADQHVREPAREFADRYHLAITDAPTSQDEKLSTYVNLRLAFTERRVAIPHDPRLLAQLRAVQKRPQPGGGMKIVVPRRIGVAHGDVVSAFVLAAHVAMGGGLVDYAAAMRGLRDGWF